MSKPRVTLRDIARRTGTSISTVSLSLRDDPRISTEVREKVQSVAKEMGYQVDMLGAMLRSTNTKMIGVTAHINDEIPLTYVGAMSAAAKDRGYRVVVANASEEALLTDALDKLRQFRVASTIAIQPHMQPSEDPESAKPHIVIAQTNPFDGTDLIRSDDRSGLIELTKHLYDQGHRSLLYIDGPEGSDGDDRRQSVMWAAEQNNLRVDVMKGGDDVDDGYRAISARLADAWDESREPGSSRLGRTTAIVCFNDLSAIGVGAGLMRAGVEIPNDVSVAGFDDSSLAAKEAFQLTSVSPSPEEIALAALDRAIERAEGRTSETDIIEVKSRLVVRQSTGPAYYLTHS